LVFSVAAFVGCKESVRRYDAHFSGTRIVEGLLLWVYNFLTVEASTCAARFMSRTRFCPTALPAVCLGHKYYYKSSMGSCS